MSVTTNISIRFVSCELSDVVQHSAPREAAHYMRHLRMLCQSAYIRTNGRMYERTYVTCLRDDVLVVVVVVVVVVVIVVVLVVVFVVGADVIGAVGDVIGLALVVCVGGGVVAFAVCCVSENTVVLSHVLLPHKMCAMF